VAKVNHRHSPRIHSQPEPPPAATVADRFKELFGWKPDRRPFHTAADRQCGRCGEIKPGGDFDVPITPGRPDLNTCRRCTG